MRRIASTPPCKWFCFLLAPIMEISMLYQKANIMNSVPLFRSFVLRNFQSDLHRRNVGRSVDITTYAPAKFRTSTSSPQENCLV